MSPVEHVSNVNWRKVISNFRASYQSVSPSEILILELIANSLDARATRIGISTQGENPLHLTVTDDGSGMGSKRVFEEYHDLGSLTKSRGGGIGWAGIGAKLYIDRCDSIYTETRSLTFTGASTWSFPRDEKAPIWQETPPRRLLGGKRGTVTEVTISDPKEIGKFRENFIRDTVLHNYNYAMEPHGDAVITLNGNRVAPFDPGDVATKDQIVSVMLKEGGPVSGIFSILKEPAPPGFALVSIVVHGKTIGEQYDFKQFARIKEPDMIAGYVECDSLINVTTTSKDSFNRKTSLWREFDKKVGKALSDWLAAEGGLEELRQEVHLERLAEDLQKDLNKVFARPEIAGLNLDLFQAINRRLAAIKDSTGESLGAEVNGSQKTTGTHGGLSEGNGVLTEGDEPGRGIRADPDGDEPIRERTRRLRGGIRILYHPFPDKPERSWVDPGVPAIVINTAHDAFKCAETWDSVPFYTVDNCFNVVTETIEDPNARQEGLNKLYSTYVSMQN